MNDDNSQKLNPYQSPQGTPSMHAPWYLLLVAAAMGVAVPVIAQAFAASVPSPPASAVVRLVSLAIVPVIVARIAYRQGFEDALRAVTAREESRRGGR